jgi:hypothetical protein
MPRPALGKVAVGDRLLVIPTTYNSRTRQEPVPATVTKAARVWIDLEEITDGYARTWRLRLDTQHDGGNGNYHDRFVTPEQYAWEQRISGAWETLRVAKAAPDLGSPWRRDEERLLALADFIRTYDEQHP